MFQGCFRDLGLFRDASVKRYLISLALKHCVNGRAFCGDGTQQSSQEEAR